MRRQNADEAGVGSWKALLAAPVIFIIILAALFAYSGIWPPLVVIESKSMQHSDTTSYIGVIDTGDLVVVKKATDASQVVTYVDGMSSGHYTYGEYGDVIIYYKSGLSKPIIHRAIVYLDYNVTGGGFDIPSLNKIPADKWAVIGGSKSCWNQKGAIDLYDVGYAQVTVHLDLAGMLNYFKDRGIAPHGGLITMGDNNWSPGTSGPVGTYDQQSIMKEPVKDAWLIGLARGEIPWFGLLKLWLTGTAPPYVPHNSEYSLLFTLGLLIGVPIFLDVSNMYLKKRGVDMFGWTQWFIPKRFRKNNVKEKEADKKTKQKDEGRAS